MHYVAPDALRWAFYVLSQVRAARLTWPEADGLWPSASHAVIDPQPAAAGGHLEPDWDAIIEALQANKIRRGRRSPVTRQLLWREYRDEARDRQRTAYSRTQFYTRLKEIQRRPLVEVEMRFTCEPGVILYSDFSGKTGKIQTRDGEQAVEILASVLRCSNQIFALAVPDQTLRSWCEARRAVLDRRQPRLNEARTRRRSSHHAGSSHP